MIQDICSKLDASTGVALAVLSFQASLRGGRDSLLRFDKTLQVYRNSIFNEDASCILTAGLLLCCTAVSDFH